jgi:hypothetical protein
MTMKKLDLQPQGNPSSLDENIVLSGDTMLLPFTLSGDEVRERLLTHVIDTDV